MIKKKNIHPNRKTDKRSKQIIKKRNRKIPINTLKYIFQLYILEM